MEWLILLVILLLAFYFRNYLRLVYLAIKLPGPHPLDPLGNIFMINDIIKVTEQCILRYGSYRLIKCWITVVPFIVLLDTQYIKKIINDKTTEKNSAFCNFLKCVVGEGLITNNGHQWKKNRKLIQAMFNINVLATFTNTFFENAEDIVRQLKGKTDLNIVSLVNQYALRNAWHSILGISISEDEGELQKRRNILSGHDKINHWTIIKALFNQIPLDKNGKLSKTELQCFIKKLIEDNTKNNNKTQLNKFKPFVDWLSEIFVENDEFTEEDVVNEASTFIHASYDTVRAAIAYSLYCLAKHQYAQIKAVQELDRICGHTTNEITVNELNEMKYLEQCIKESLRIYPSAPFFLRQVTQEVALGDHVLPVGTNIIISPIVLHRLPHLFPDPLKFDPERFSKENISKIDPYAFIPFSKGPRNCIGYQYAVMEMKMFLASLLRKYHMSLIPGQEDLKFTFNVTLIAKGGIWLRFKERNLNT